MLVKKAPSVLHVSYSSLEDFKNCPRYYFYKRIKKLERPTFNIHFLIGRVVHEGVYWIFRKPDKAMKRMLRMYKAEVEQARKQYKEMSVDDEQNLVFWKEGVKGMLAAFRSRYLVPHRKFKFVANEVPIRYPLSKKVTIVGKLDNIVANPKRKVHELKTAKGIDEQRISSVQTDPQTGLYFWIFNKICKPAEKLYGIIYDIIKKPSIRQRQNESKSEFMERLGNWYESLEGGIKFHREAMDKPLIQGEEVLNTVIKRTDLMLRCKEKADYWQEFSYCIHDWGKCEFFELCHEGGETKANLKLYQIRPSYKVVDK